MTHPGFDPGSIHLRLRWSGGRADAVDLRVERPAAAGFLRGRAAAAAVRMLPLLYSICGTAQAAAAAAALRAARGEPQAPTIDAEVLAEARREHLWRLLLDWPQALGLPRQEALLVAVRRRLQAGDIPDRWEAALGAPWDAIEQALRTCPAAAAGAVQLLPPLTADESLALWPRLAADFAVAPDYRGAAAETGALARHPELAGEAPLLARVRARMADLADGSVLGRISAATVAHGVGRAAVETARGLLLHEIVLDGECVADYVIVAPTEWNFHPSGALRAWLDGVAAATADDLRALSARAILALDPCVPSHIDIVATGAA